MLKRRFWSVGPAWRGQAKVAPLRGPEQKDRGFARDKKNGPTTLLKPIVEADFQLPRPLRFRRAFRGK
jgi:hypothetical protein